MPKVRRNDPCPCGSGEKYKYCCARELAGKKAISPGKVVVAVVLVLGVLAYYGQSSRTQSVISSSSPFSSVTGSNTSATPFSEIPGLDLKGLTEAERSRVLERANAENCSCGCGLTVAACRHLDTSCGTSLPMARQILSEVRSGG